MSQTPTQTKLQQLEARRDELQAIHDGLLASTSAKLVSSESPIDKLFLKTRLIEEAILAHGELVHELDGCLAVGDSPVAVLRENAQARILELQGEDGNGGLIAASLQAINALKADPELATLRAEAQTEREIQVLSAQNAQMETTQRPVALKPPTAPVTLRC